MLKTYASQTVSNENLWNTLRKISSRITYKI